MLRDYNFTAAKILSSGEIELFQSQGKCLDIKLDEKEILTLVLIDIDSYLGNDIANNGSAELTSSFLISKYTITQKQWYIIMHSFPEGGNLDFKKPVTGVSWIDALEFCRKLSERENREFRLPYQSEWEFACCAGSSKLYGFGNLLTSNLANYGLASSKAGIYTKDIPEPIVPVGIFPANGLGIHDMHGNVWEWCMDEHPDPNHASLRSVRGGAYYSSVEDCTCSSQGWMSYRKTDQVTGFRIVLPM